MSSCPVLPLQHNLSIHVSVSRVSLLKTAYEEGQDQIETVHKENKTLSGAVVHFGCVCVDSHHVFLTMCPHSVHEQQKAKKKLEVEKEELQLGLEEAEASLEVKIVFFQSGLAVSNII